MFGVRSAWRGRRDGLVGRHLAVAEVPLGQEAGTGPLVGCGGVSAFHLAAYREAGFPVTALYSRTRSKAEARRDEFAPHAAVFGNIEDLIEREDVGVVDFALHPESRVALIEAALRALIGP